jgi:hypothetical protein
MSESPAVGSPLTTLTYKAALVMSCVVVDDDVDISGSFLVVATVALRIPPPYWAVVAPLTIS